jgi:hypothetical protein
VHPSNRIAQRQEEFHLSDHKIKDDQQQRAAHDIVYVRNDQKFDVFDSIKIGDSWPL